ncbi:hypothetical protein BGC30_06360 [Novacetimonas hansenii]|nr:hypothetical protein BGC30_06360 [Novacetimonas hansenii]
MVMCAVVVMGPCVLLRGWATGGRAGGVAHVDRLSVQRAQYANATCMMGRDRWFAFLLCCRRVQQEAYLTRIVHILGLFAFVLALAACASTTPGKVDNRADWQRWGYAEGLKKVASY